MKRTPTDGRMDRRAKKDTPEWAGRKEEEGNDQAFPRQYRRSDF